MAVRIEGVNIPMDKRVVIALTYIYGIGRNTAKRILLKAQLVDSMRTHELTDADVIRLREIIANDYTVEGDLRREVSRNIKRKMDIGNYAGLRHRRNLPVRGQRTHTNARTRKGKKRGPIANKKK